MYRFLNEILLVLVIAIVGGVGSALIVLDQSRDSGSLAIGPWTAIPGVPGPQDNPYARAAAAAETALPLDIAEGIVFTARTDSDGEALLAQCDYVISGRTPSAALWSLSVYDRDEGLMANPAGRTGFHSGEILRLPDGGFAIALSQTPKSGNWLPVTGSGGLVIVLRLYDTPVSTGLQSVPVMPAIIRERCQ